MNAATSKAVRYLAVVLLCLVVAITRFGMPWRMDVTNDEMIHLESYRNHYDSDDIFPEFNERLSSLKFVPKPILSAYLKAYKKSAIVQRVPLLLIDAHPPVHPVLAEVSAAVTHSNLLAIRLLSLVAGVSFVALMYFAGRAYKDEPLGLWSAALVAVSISAAIYSGIGRSYPFAQAAAAAILWAYFVQQKNPERPLRSFLLVALLAQATDWMLWPIVAPFLVAAIFLHVKSGGKFGEVARKAWWYVLASLLLAIELFIQTKNPTIANALHPHSLSEAWHVFCVVSPLSGLSNIGLPATAGAVLFLAALFGGGAVAYLDKERSASERYGLLAATAVSLLLIPSQGSEVRFMMAPIVVPTFLAAVGIGKLFRERWQADLALCVLLTIELIQSVLRPEDPYRRIFPEESNYSAVAARLAAEMKPGAKWMAIPFFRGNCLFPYGSFPAPLSSKSDADIDAGLKTCTEAAPCYVFTNYTVKKDLAKHASYLSAPGKEWNFWNGFRLLRIAPPSAPDGATP